MIGNDKETSTYNHVISVSDEGLVKYKIKKHGSLDRWITAKDFRLIRDMAEYINGLEDDLEAYISEVEDLREKLNEIKSK